MPLAACKALAKDKSHEHKKRDPNGIPNFIMLRKFLAKD